VFAALAFIGSAPAHAASDAICGTTLTESLTLTEDVDCTGYSGVALTLAAPDITLDGAGFRFLAPDASVAISVASTVTGVTIENIDVLGWCTGVGVQITGGSGHTIRNLRADGRSIGLDIKNTSALTLADIEIDAAAEVALALKDITLPLTLENLALTGSAIGLTLDGFDGPFSLDAAAIADISGNDVGISFVTNVSNVTVSDLAIDGADLGINAPHSSLQGLTFRDLDLSSPIGAGTGLYLTGPNHTLENITVIRREFGVRAVAAEDLTINGLIVSGATNTGLRLNAPVGQLDLSNVAIRYSKNAVWLSDFAPTTPVLYDAFDAAAGEGSFRFLGDNDINLLLQNVGNVTFAGFAADALITSIDASATTNRNLGFTDLDLSTKRRGGTGLALAGTNHRITRVTANDLQYGISAIGVVGLTVDHIIAARNSTSGLRLESVTGTVSLRRLDLQDNSQALTLVDFAGTQAIPRVINGWNAGTNTGAIETVAGSTRGIDASNTRDVIFENLVLPNRQAGLYLRDADNTRLVARNIDATGPGDGNGVDMAGLNHRVENVIAHTRANGLFLSAASGTVVTGLQASRCSTAGISLIGYTSTQAAPTFANVDIRDNARGFSFASCSKTMTISGSNGIDMAGSSTGVFLSFSQNITFEDLRLDTTTYGVLATQSSNASLTFRRVDASSVGGGIGFALRGNTHKFFSCVANDRATGLSFTNGSALQIDGLTAQRATDAALAIDTIGSTLTRPTLTNLDLRDSNVGLRLTGVQPSMTIDANTNLDVTGSHIGIELASISGHTIRNISLKTTGTAILAESGNSNLTLTDLDLTGYGTGVGIKLGREISTTASFAAGSNHIVTDVLFADRGIGLIAINPDNLTLRRLTFVGNTTGLFLQGLGQSVPGTLGAPVLDTLMFDNNGTAVALTDVRQALVLDGTTHGLTFANNLRGITIEKSRLVTVRNATLGARDFGVLAGNGNTELTFSDLDLSGPAGGIGIQLGTDASNVLLNAGTTHRLERLTIDDRATGVLALGATSLTLTELTVRRATDKAIRLVDTTRPLTLTRLSLLDSATGLELDGLSGTAATPLSIRSATAGFTTGAITSLTGCDTGILLKRTSYLSLNTMTIDARARAIDADATTNNNLSFVDLDLSGPFAGIGLVLSGATHSLLRVISNSRAVGVQINGASALTLNDVRAAAASTAAIRLVSVTYPISMTGVRATDSAAGLVIQTTGGTGSLALNSTSVAGITGNLNAIMLTSATGVTVDSAGLGVTNSSGTYKTAAPANDALCGQTVAASVTLSADLNCPSTTGAVFTVNSPDITINGGGFRVVAPHASAVVSATNQQRITVRDLNLSGRYAFGDGVFISGGSGHVVSNVTASRRARGVNLQGTQDSQITNLTVENASIVGLRIVGHTVPLTLTALNLVNGDGTGVHFENIDGTPTDTAGANLVLGLTAFRSLTGNATSIALAGLVSDINFDGLPALDGRTFGLNADGIGNLRLSFINPNVTGPRASGVGLALSGTNHSVTGLISSRRGTTLDFRGGTGFSLDAPRITKSSVAGIRLFSLGTGTTLNDLSAEGGAIGLLLAGTTRTAATQLTVGRYTTGTGAVTSLLRNGISLQVEGSAYLRVENLRLDGALSGLRALTGNTNLTLAGLDLSAAQGAGTGLELAGAGHTLTDLVASRRGVGYQVQNTTNLVMARATARGALGTGFSFSAIASFAGVERLSAPYATVGVALQSLTGTAAIPIAITGFDATMGVGAISDLKGTDTAIRVTNSSYVRLLGVAAPGRTLGVDVATAGSTFVSIEDADLSGPRGLGTGASLTGADLTVRDTTIIRRAAGVAATSAPRLTLNGLSVVGATVEGVKLSNTTPPFTLRNLSLTRGADGLSLSGITGAVATPIVIDAWNAGQGTGAIASLEDNLVSLRLVSSRYVDVKDLTLDGEVNGLLANVGNRDLTLRRLNMNGPGAGMGLTLQGLGHSLSDLTADIRSTGLRFETASGVIGANLRARYSAIGLSLHGYSQSNAVPVFTGLDFRDNDQGVVFTSWSSTGAFGPGTGLDVTGSSTGVLFGTSTTTATLKGVTVSALSRGIGMNTFSQNLVFENLNLVGRGNGFGLLLVGFGHVIRNVSVTGFGAGISATGSYGARHVFETVSVSGCTTGVSLDNYNNASQGSPTVSGLSLPNNSVALYISQLRVPFLLDGANGFSVAGSVVGVQFVTTNYDVTLQNLSLHTLGTAVDVPLGNDRHVFRNINASGFGRGVAFSLASGANHLFEDVVVHDREGGIVGTSTSALTLDFVGFRGISGPALSLSSIKAPLLPPAFTDVSIVSASTGLRFADFDGPLALNGAGLTTVRNNSIGVEYTSGVQNVTLSDLRTSATAFGISAAGTDNHGNTFQNVDVSGQCRGVGIALKGSDHRLLDFTAANRATAVQATDVAGLSIADGSIGASRQGITVTGTPPAINTTVAVDAANSTTRLKITNITNIYVGQKLTFNGTQRTVATIAGSILTLTTALASTPAAGAVVRSLTYNQPVLAVLRTDVCANGTGLSVSGGSATATSNYWRDPSGPRHTSNPTGTGDRVVATTVTLSPWLLVPFDKATPYCNNAPIPDAGDAMTVCQGDTVTLDGTGSFDPDDEPITYRWTQVTGQTVPLSTTDTATATFDAPGPTLIPGEDPGPEELTFRLSIQDDFLTRADEVTITVYRQNRAPTADAGTDFDVAEDSPVALDATGTADPESGTLHYGWVQVSGTPVALTSADSSQPSFTAPALDVGGEPVSEYLVFEVTVTDEVPEFYCGGVQTDTATVTVEVRNLNTRPDVVVADDQEVCAGDPVILDASDSSDRDGDPLEFTWTQDSGQSVAISNADSATAAFIAPEPTGAPGPQPDPIVLAFGVVLFDGYNTSAGATSITVKRTNVRPTATVAPGTTLVEGASTTLDATASTDPEEMNLTYAWVQTSGTAATITGADTATPDITSPLLDVGGGDINDTLIFEVTVTDSVPNGRCGMALSHMAEVELIVANLNTSPMASAGDDTIALPGRTVTLDGTASVDPDGDALVYTWTQISGVTAGLSGANSANPTFTTPTRGDNDSEFLVFRVSVADGFGGTDVDDVTVILGRACANVSQCGDGNDCTVDICLELGYCAWSPEPARTACGDGWLCDGANTCVQCLVQTDCIDPWTCTVDSCVDFACNYIAEPQGYPCEVGICSGLLAQPACIPDVTTTVSITYPVRNAYISESDVPVRGTGEIAAAVFVTMVNRNDPRISYTTDTVVDEDGEWAVVFPGTPDGGWTVLVVATDHFNNTAGDGPVPFIVDSRAPKLTLTAPINGALLNSGTVTVRGIGDRNRAVRITVDGIELGDATTDGNGVFAFLVPRVLLDGPHEVIGVMLDAAGNVATARTAFDVDTEAPWLRLERPGEDRIFTERTVEFGGFGEPAAKVTLVIFHTDADPEVEFGRFSAVVKANGQWTVTSDAMSDGTYRAEARGRDAAGNDSVPETVEFEVNSLAPNLAIDKPFRGALMKATSPTIAGSTHARATITITVKRNGGTEVVTGEPEVDEAGAFAWNVTPALGDGLYDVTAVATGPNGLTTTVETSFTVDTTAPTLTIDSPSEAETLKSAWATITGKAEAGTQVTLYIDGQELADVNVYNNTEWLVPLEAPLNPGPHTASAIGRDPAGNSVTVTVSFIVESDGITGPGDGTGTGNGNGGGTGTSDGCGGAGGHGEAAWLLLLACGLLLARQRRAKA